MSVKSQCDCIETGTLVIGKILKVTKEYQMDYCRVEEPNRK